MERELAAVGPQEPGEEPEDTGDQAADLDQAGKDDAIRGDLQRTLEATAEPEEVPWAWRRFAFRSYLALQRLDNQVLEPHLPPQLFYNLLVAARKPEG